MICFLLLKLLSTMHAKRLQGKALYLNNGRHPRMPSKLALGLEPKKDPAASDFTGQIEKALSRARF